MPINVLEDSEARRLKIAVMGSGDVGKTSIIRDIVSDPIAKLASICNTDMGLSYHVNISNISMDITEVSLSPVDNIAPLLDLNPAIQTSHAFVLVYAVDDLASFDYLETVKDAIVKSRSSDVPVIVVGNKTDLIRCAIDYEVVDCIVSIDWEMYYTETSAKTDDSVTAILPSLFHHRKLRHHHFPSQIKAEYGSLKRTVSKRNTVSIPNDRTNTEDERVRSNSDCLNKMTKKQIASRRANQIKVDFLESINNINVNRERRKSLNDNMHCSTDQFDGTNTSFLPKHSKVQYLLRTPSARASSSGVSSGQSNMSSGGSSPIDENSTLKFLFDVKKRSSISSSVNSSGGFSLSPQPMRHRCNTFGVQQQPRPDGVALLANRRVSYSGATELVTVLEEKRNNWISSIIRFLKK